MEVNELVHHGILGMKWGVRRYQNKDGTLTKAGKARYKADDDKYERLYGEDAIKEVQRKAAQSPEEEVRELTKMVEAEKHSTAKDNKRSKKSPEQLESERQKKNDVKNRGTLSNDQLKEKIERLKLEKELRELTSSEVSAGQKFVEDILKDVGKKTISTVLTGAALYGVKTAAGGKGTFNRKDLADAMFNGGPKKK